MIRIPIAVTVKAPPSVVWSLITDIEGAPDTISGIDRIEVLERPAEGILGLRWRETRTLYGKSATETMWITEVDEGSSYATEARSHGSLYRTEVRVTEIQGGTRLEMEFSARALTRAARIMAVLLGWLVTRSVRKALRQDLEDIRRAAEARAAESSS